MARQNVLEMPEQPIETPDATPENGEAKADETPDATPENGEAKADEKKTKRPKRSLREVAKDEYDAAQERVNKLKQQLIDAEAVLAYKAQNPLLKEETVQ